MAHGVNTEPFIDIYTVHVESYNNTTVTVLGTSLCGDRCSIVIRNIDPVVYVIPRQSHAELFSVPSDKLPLTPGVQSEEIVSTTPNYKEVLEEIQQHAMKACVTIKHHAPFYGEYPADSTTIPSGVLQCIRVVIDSRSTYTRFGPDESGFTFLRIVGSRVPASTRFAASIKLHGPEWVRFTGAVPVNPNSPEHITLITKEYRLDRLDGCVSTLREMALAAQTDDQPDISLPPHRPVIVLELHVFTNSAAELAMVAYRYNPAHYIFQPTTTEQTNGSVRVLISRAAFPTIGALTDHSNAIGFVDNEKTLLSVLRQLVAGDRHPDFLICSNIDRTCAILIQRAQAVRVPEIIRFFSFLPKDQPHTNTDTLASVRSRRCPGLVLLDMARVCHKLTRHPIQNNEIDTLATTFGCGTPADIQAAHDSNIKWHGVCSAPELSLFVRGAIATIHITWAILQKVNVWKLVWSVSDATSSSLQSCAGWIATRQIDAMLSLCHHDRSLTPDPQQYGDKQGRVEKGRRYKGGLNLPPTIGLCGGPNEYIVLLDVIGMYSTIAATYFADTVHGELIASLRTMRNIALSERSKLPPTSDQYEFFDLKQQAFKLASNSITGAMGRREFRYCLADFPARVTSIGRQALTECAKAMGPCVVYGDTDSIMMRVMADSVPMARQMASQLAEKCTRASGIDGLSMSICAIIRRCLIISKKKYAYQDAETNAIVKKGLDSVRHDWCPLGRTLSDNIMTLLLTGDNTIQSITDVIVASFKETIANDPTHSISRFVITKSLSKDPSEYRSGSIPAHVAAARASSRKYASGDYVDYVMCLASPTPVPMVVYPVRGVPVANHMIDVKWYIQKQLIPMVSRILCAALGADISRTIIDKALTLCGIEFDKHKCDSKLISSIAASNDGEDGGDGNSGVVASHLSPHAIATQLEAFIDSPDPNNHPLVNLALEHPAIQLHEFIMVCPSCTAFETWMEVVNRCSASNDATCSKCNAIVTTSQLEMQFTLYTRKLVDGATTGLQWCPDVFVYLRKHYDMFWRSRVSDVPIPPEMSCTETSPHWVPRCVAIFKRILDTSIPSMLRPGSYIIDNEITFL